eukprot:4842123-Pyramimonas_sp.AAC.1
MAFRIVSGMVSRTVSRVDGLPNVASRACRSPSAPGTPAQVTAHIGQCPPPPFSQTNVKQLR